MVKFDGRRHGWPIALIAALVALLAACDDTSEGAAAEGQDPNMPPAQVDLPEPPPASGFEVPETNPDGTMRIAGLIQFRDKYLQKPVRISGVITALSTECDPAKAKKEGTECPEPHLFIKDEPEARKQLLVVGYKPEFVERAKLEVGQRHVFEGTYKQVSQGFAVTEDGLLLLDRVGETEVLEEDK